MNADKHGNSRMGQVKALLSPIIKSFFPPSRLSKSVFIFGCLSFVLSSLLYAATYPQWWAGRNVLTNAPVVDDYSALNAGQLKWMAKMAKAEMDELLPGGAGPEVTALVAAFSHTNNYAPVNMGQLKHVAKCFYDRLIALGYTNAYPWSATTVDDNNHAMVAVGQLKVVFNWDLYSWGLVRQASGMSDEWMLENFGTLAVDPDGDEDGDGLTNAEECALETDPNEVDKDGDGLTDLEEVLIGTEPLVGDSDGDGLSDGDEVLVYGTDPNKIDTDGDGMSDGDEVLSYDLDPLSPDSDCDGLLDGAEYISGSNAFVVDTDGDGLPDGWEVRHGMDPIDGDNIQAAGASFQATGNNLLSAANVFPWAIPLGCRTFFYVYPHDDTVNHDYGPDAKLVLKFPDCVSLVSTRYKKDDTWTNITPGIDPETGGWVVIAPFESEVEYTIEAVANSVNFNEDEVIVNYLSVPGAPSWNTFTTNIITVVALDDSRVSYLTPVAETGKKEEHLTAKTEPEDCAELIGDHMWWWCVGGSPDELDWYWHFETDLNPGTYRVWTLNGWNYYYQPNLANHNLRTVTVVEVAKIQAKSTAPGAALTDGPKTIRLGEGVVLVATPNPTPSFPYGNPVWSVVSRAPGSTVVNSDMAPGSATVTADAGKIGRAGVYEFKATCGGSSKTITINVVDVDLDGDVNFNTKNDDPDSSENTAPGTMVGHNNSSMVVPLTKLWPTGLPKSLNTGKVVLKVTGTNSKIKIWDGITPVIDMGVPNDMEETWTLGSGTVATLGALPELTMEGIDVNDSSASGDIGFELTYVDADGATLVKDEIKATVVEMDLKADFNHDKDTSNDDNDNIIEETGTGLMVAKGGPSRTKLELKIAPSDLNIGKIELLASAMASGGSIQIYTSETGGTPLIDPGNSSLIKKTWDLSLVSITTIPKELWIEGTRGSADAGDVKVGLSYTKDGQLRHQDRLCVTVVNVDLDGDANCNGSNDDPEATENLIPGTIAGMNNSAQPSSPITTLWLSGAPASLDTGKVVLKATGTQTKIKICEGTNPVIDMGTGLIEKTWPLGSGTTLGSLPSLSMVGIENTALSKAGDIGLELYYEDAAGHKIALDEIKATGVEVDLMADFNHDEDVSNDANNNTTEETGTGLLVGKGATSRTRVGLKMTPSDLKVGKVKLQVASNPSTGAIKVYGSKTGTDLILDSAVTAETTWNISITQIPADLWVEGTKESATAGDVKVSVVYEKDGHQKHRDTVAVSVIAAELDGLRVYDPKLENAGNAPIKFKVKSAISSFTPRIELAVMDGAEVVASIVRKEDPGPVLGAEIIKNWDGRWGMKMDGTTPTLDKDKYAGPTKYKIELKIYDSASSANICMKEEYNLYVVRLGVRQVGFQGDQELTYHKTTKDNTANYPFTSAINFADDIVWKIEHIDYLKAVGVSRTEARKEQSPMGESYTDTDNAAGCSGTESYIDEDGNGAYSSGLRQVNFPQQKPSGGVEGTRFNRPAVYVKSSPLKIWFKFGAQAMSDLTLGDCGVGYPIGDYPICVGGKHGGLEMGGTTEPETALGGSRQNINPSGGPYQLTSSTPLANTVGFGTETVELTFKYNKKGESFIDSNGNGIYDTGGFFSSGETIINDNGNNLYDVEWENIPGKQTTTHLIYRIAATPAANAKTLDGRLWMKIIDFTCDWASLKTTPAGVFDEIWKTDHFWTPFAAGPCPDNANGFRGVGDPTERAMTDAWAHTKKCYTYQHDQNNTYPGPDGLMGTLDDIGDGQSVDQALDLNYARCGGWSPFLLAFMGTHGINGDRQLMPRMRWRFVSNAGAVSFEDYQTAMVHNNNGRGPGDTPAQAGDAWYKPFAIEVLSSGQANPFIPIDPVTGGSTRLANMFIAYPTHTDHEFVKYSGRYYDGSYEHSGGTSYTTINSKADAGISHYLYGNKYRFVGGAFIPDNASLPREHLWTLGGWVPSLTLPGIPMLRVANDPTMNEMEEQL